MATQAVAAPGGRTNRLVVLVSHDEKARISAHARAAEMSVSDYLRTAGERYVEPTEAERLLLRDLVRSLEEANVQTDAALARLEAATARAESFDEDAYRAKVEAELAERDDVDWDALADALGLGGR